jgi:hypothetical protein
MNTQISDRQLIKPAHVPNTTHKISPRYKRHQQWILRVAPVHNGERKQKKYKPEQTVSPSRIFLENVREQIDGAEGKYQ